ncbi:MAG: class I SAM-dependent methyltransferase [Bacteroidia bacterium]|nr:class I SAM-dependent methyltransferase [Bacteroidia bacterium]MDW8089638.1 class I SAM-dependent methyltransferase [Bacteroidia bacterium]
MEYRLLSPHWEAYELIEFGEGWRWERWGEVWVQRPDSWAVGKVPMTPPGTYHVYHPTGSYTGQWTPPLPSKWLLTYRGQGWQMALWARSGKFKHLGFFPEQAVHWEWLYTHLRRASQARVLNLFAYTGAASLAAALAGAQVVHVDSSKSAITWAAENARANNIATIRWIPEDVRRFVARAGRRKEKYYALLLDPPAYGTGAGRWHLAKDLPPLLENLRPLLSNEGGLFLINWYAGDFSPYTLYRLVREIFPFMRPVEVGELLLTTPKGRQLSTGYFLRSRWG